MIKITKPQLVFLTEVSKKSVTVLNNIRINKSSRKSIFTIKAVYIDGDLQHFSKIKTATYCLENRWIQLTRNDDFYLVTLTESGMNELTKGE